MTTGSLRTRIVLRFTTLMAASFGVGGVVAVTLLRSALTAQLDGTLLRLASIEAAAVSDSPDSSVHFHEGVFTAQSATAPDLARYAEVWSVDGHAVVRSPSLGMRDLPLLDGVLGRVASGRVELITATWDGEAVRSVVYPLGLVGRAHRDHILQVAAPLRPVGDALRSIIRVLLGLGVTATGLAFIGAWALAGHAVRPAREIAEQAESISVGSIGARITAHAEVREYERLVGVLNAMLGRLEMAFDVQRRFVADAGHEIRHPVAILRAALELALRRSRSVDEYRAAIGDALAETDRISGLAEGLLTLARADAGVLDPQREPVDLAHLAHAASARAATIARSRQVELTVRAAPAVVDADADLVARALDNLLNNAIKFTPPHGRVEVVLEADGEAALIHVIDTGPGVPPDQAIHLFDRFYRGDPSRASGAGAGLGLAIAKSIAEAHGGTVSYARAYPGSRFTIHLPG